MFHSNVAFAYCGGSNEFLRGGGRPGSPCQAWARSRHRSTAAKLNLMFHSPQERCINQSFWFAWTVASDLIPCKHKAGQNMMSREKQCNLTLPNKNKQQAGPFNSARRSHVKCIIKTMAPSRNALSFKERGSHFKSLISFLQTRKMKVWTFKINKNQQKLSIHQNRGETPRTCQKFWSSVMLYVLCFSDYQNQFFLFANKIK